MGGIIKNKIKVFLVCTGLGHINRGYESFSRECFDSLKDSENLDLYLFKGAGESSEKEKVCFNIKRTGRLGKMLGMLIRKDSYFIEQLTFFFSFIKAILLKKPDVIYYSDFLLGCWLFHLRRFFNLKYKLLFSNGAPNGPPFNTSDHVQQLLNHHLEIAKTGNENLSKHSVVPYGVKAIKAFTPPSYSSKKELRQSLSLPLEKKILISVGAVNKYHKRMDYLIQEVADIKDENIFCLILGQKTDEFLEIERLAEQLLGKENFKILSVSNEKIDRYYLASDVFVLASLSEGLPRVLLEALSYGLPICVHDYPIAREILQEFGSYSNFSKRGELGKLVKEVLSIEDTIEKKQMRYKYLYKNFSWDNLKFAYLKMIEKTAKK